MKGEWVENGGAAAALYPLYRNSKNHWQSPEHLKEASAMVEHPSN